MRALEIAAVLMDEGESEGGEPECDMLEVNDFYVDVASKDRQKLYDKLKKNDPKKGEKAHKTVLKIKKASKKDKPDKMNVDKPPPKGAYVEEPTGSVASKPPAPLLSGQ